MIKGLIAPILTPFDNNLNVNQSMYNDLAKSLMDKGCSGLAPFGTTGEALLSDVGGLIFTSRYAET